MKLLRHCCAYNDNHVPRCGVGEDCTRIIEPLAWYLELPVSRQCQKCFDLITPLDYLNAVEL